MRKDIEIHIQTADVALSPQNKFKLRDFRWVDGPEELRYIYGEITVPYTLSEKAIRENGLYVTIPYTPLYREFKIRIYRENGEAPGHYVINETNRSVWHEVKAAINGGDLKNVFASTLPIISETSFFIRLVDGVAQIYSCDQSDFNIINANRQNANCMLACIPGCNYRYPLTGVGLVRWVNSTNVMASGLTQVLQEEFGADGVTINNAAYDYDTKQMALDLRVQEEE